MDLTIKKPDGTPLPLIQAGSALRGYSRAEQKQELLNTDTFSLTIESAEPVDLVIGCTIAVFGQLYTLNNLPTVRRDGQHRFVYDLTFEGPQYHLLRVTFFDSTVAGNSLSASFSLTGNLAFFADVLFYNIARVFGGAWGLGTIAVPGESGNVAGNLTATKTLTFENENCLQVLQRLCTEYKTEFSIEYRPLDAPNRVLNIAPAGSVLTDVFSYGQGNGLYTLTRQGVQGEQFYTRAYVFGGSKNLPVGYRGFATRLQLPIVGTPPTTYDPRDSFVENTGAIAAFGLIEGVKVFEEIYPRFVGTVSYANNTEPVQYFADDTIGFNPKELESYTIGTDGYPILKFRYLVPGLTPKVSFLTGDLAGYNFELTDFAPNNGIIRIKPFTDANGLAFPSPDPASPFRVKIGDTYTLIDLNMPDAYVTAAESKLQAAATAWLAENGYPKLTYTLTLDELYLQGKANDFGAVPIDSPPNSFAVGDVIRVLDTELGIDKLSRILGFNRDAKRPYRYTLTVGDQVKQSLVEKILIQQAQIKVIAKEAINLTPKPAEVKQAVTDGIKDWASVFYPKRATVSPVGFEPSGIGLPKFGAKVYNNGRLTGSFLSSIREQVLNRFHR